MSFSCILYPAVGSSCTQLLGSIVPCPLGSPLPIRWVRLYLFAGYNSTHSLGTKQTTKQSHGLLEPVDPQPGVTAAVAHADAATVEVQAVRGVGVP